MERLVGVWIEEMSVERPDGATLRETLALIDALHMLCPFSEVVRLGFFVFPVRGPSRFFGGDDAVLRATRQSVIDVTGYEPALGIGEGLFCTEIAAKKNLVLAEGQSEEFRRRLPLTYLGSKDVATTCRRLGLHTIGAFGDLQRARVAERFAKQALVLHALARGEIAELQQQRDRKLATRLAQLRGDYVVDEEQMGFFGQRGASDQRAEVAAHRLRRRLGPDGVLTASLRGGRFPEDRAALVPWGSPEPAREPEAPWPGQLRSPAPATTLQQPVEVQLRDEHDEKVTMLTRGLLSTSPTTLLFSSQLRREIIWHAGPWPLIEKWWQVGRARAHVQALLATGEALLLVAEASRWWLVGIYD